MTEEKADRPRVRPWLRRTAILVCVLLLPIAVHALWDYVEARRLSSVVEGIRQRSERVYFGAHQQRPVTPEQRQASRYYAAAALLARDARADRFRQTYETIEQISRLRPAAAAHDPRLDQLREVVEAYAPMLDLLDRAAALDARGIEYSDETHHAVPDRYLANVNAVRIARLSFLGDARNASKALLATLEMDRVSSHLFRLGVDTSDSLRLLLTFAPPPDAELRRLQEHYQRADLEDQVEHAVIDDRARLISALWPAASGPMPVLPRIGGYTWLRGPAVPFVLRPWITRQLTQSLQQYNEALGAARQPWPAKLNAAKSLGDKYPAPRFERSTASGLSRYFQNLFVSPWRGANQAVQRLRLMTGRAASETAMRRVAITVLAVERYRRANAGSVPSTLSDLVPGYLAAVPQDPFSGAPLQYTRDATSYKVYSVGSNRKDDAGDWNDIDRKEPRPRLEPIVPKDIGLDIRINH